MKKTPTIAELKELCLKKGVYVGLDKYLSAIAVYITKILLYTPLKPMQVMFLWFLLQLAACYIIVQGTYAHVLIGIVLFHFAIILDHVDGQMARYKKEQSILALYVDQIYHNIANPLFIMVLSIAADVFWIGVTIVLFYMLNRIIIFNPFIYNLQDEKAEKTIEEVVKKDQGKLAYSRLKAHEKTFISHVYEWFRIEHPLSVIFWGALFGLLEWTLMLYLALFIVDFFRRLRSQIKSLLNVDRILYK